LKWLANITNAKTLRFYEFDVAEVIAFTGLLDQAALRSVARAHFCDRRRRAIPQHTSGPGL
jgi:hypothetical protein